MTLSNKQTEQIEWVADVIRKSGIASKIQREAIIQRIVDAANKRADNNALSIPHRTITAS